MHRNFGLGHIKPKLVDLGILLVSLALLVVGSRM